MKRSAVLVGRRARCASAALLFAFTGCTYMQAVTRQSDLASRQAQEPSLPVLKHLLDTETYYVYGRVLDPDGAFAGRALAVAAYADAFGRIELVDVMHGAIAGTHYGLNLPHAPESAYRLVVLCDENVNGQLDPHEVIGDRLVTPEQRAGSTGVLENLDITLSRATFANVPAPIPVPPPHATAPSLFFPGGTIRHLDDPIFDLDVATLGVYEPAAFLEKASTMFYALEEDVGFKIPVVLVHGIGGSPRQFDQLLQRLDRKRFKPWFFYYPSGADLAQLGELFHRIFLSGDAVTLNPLVPTVIVAHSMGGLVVREALNLVADGKRLGEVRFVSIASPLGGHAAAAAGEQYGLIVVPSWRSLNPAGGFVTGLYRRPLPPNVVYHLTYAFRDDGMLRFGENSDGVVPLSSQLRPEAQAEASVQRGFDATHTGILGDEHALAFLVNDIESVETLYPPAHMAWLQKGGFVWEGECSRGAIAKYAVESVGQYLRALATGEIEPVDELQRHFVAAARGEVPPTQDIESAWIEFVARHPEPVPTSGE